MRDNKKTNATGGEKPLFWDDFDSKEKPVLVEAEVRRELQIEYAKRFLKLTDEDLQREIKLQEEWIAFREKWDRRTDLKKDVYQQAEESARRLIDECCKIPIDENGRKIPGEYEIWEEKVNTFIREKIDCLAILNVFEQCGRNALREQAVEKSMKRHSENHAMRDEVFSWLDKNKTPTMALDTAAEMMAGKIVPLKFRTVRDHCTEWNRLRSAGTP